MEKIYPEDVHHYSLGSPVISIWSKPVMLSSSGELPTNIPEQCLHTRVVEMN
jgi:hypothetical protein